MSQLPRRLMYFCYYLRRMDWGCLHRFMTHIEAERGLSPAAQWKSMVRDSLKFNVSILEWYQFRFFDLTDAQKSNWAGTGTMYEFQRHANPPAARGLLNDKRRFYKAYRRFFRHELLAREELEHFHIMVKIPIEPDCFMRVPSLACSSLLMMENTGSHSS